MTKRKINMRLRWEDWAEKQKHLLRPLRPEEMDYGGGGLARIPVKEKTLKTFLSHVFVNKKTGCWVYTGRLRTTGYSEVSWWVDNARFRIKGHRLIYLLFCGNIQSGKIICHSCDHPPCVNPRHLWMGTHSQNARDAVEKGAIGCGEHSPSSVLSNKSVGEIKRLCLGRAHKQRDVAKMFGVRPSTISSIVAGYTWIASKGTPCPKTKS